MAKVDVKTLADAPLLQGATREVLQGMAGTAIERRYRPGETILQEGSEGRDFYMILEGRVEVKKGEGPDEIVLAHRGPGDFFGEMALIEQRPRFATVQAIIPTRALEFSETDFTSVLFRQPSLLHRIGRELSSRLREADRQMIVDLQRKNAELATAYRDLQQAQAALVEKERLERELELARDLQQSILPLRFPCLPGFGFAARSRPARQVGGDFYDVISLRKGQVGLVMADVSDKGMPSALYMALAHSLVHAEAKRRRSPRRVLLTVHRLLMEMTQSDMFVTAFYGVLDPFHCTLRYVRAGHDRPLLYSAATGDCRFLTGDGMLLGMIEEVYLHEESVRLSPGDLLVLYSDGITDASSPSGGFFGAERLRQAMCRAAGKPAQQVVDQILSTVDRFCAGADQSDDMALLVVTVGLEQ
jgi:serine phosphatase RsbU (regulator of sigma subunit)